MKLYTHALVIQALLVLLTEQRARAESLPNHPQAVPPSSQTAAPHPANPELDTDAPQDEAMSGRTLIGTPVRRRGLDDFPAEYRDVFWAMDQVPTGPGGMLEPLNFDRDGDGVVNGEGPPGRAEIDAIRGRNTWILWGGGNEAFWGWLQERGYGIADFLILLDGRRRGDRFLRTGMINQPGFVPHTDASPSVLGLYLDKPKSVRLTEPVRDSATGKIKQQNGNYESTAITKYSDSAYTSREPLFETGTDALAREMLADVKAWFSEADDGLNPDVYGYPSGVIGLRLMLNPDFFGATPAADKARAYWKSNVIDTSHSNYYTDVHTHADPKLIRPFRVSMSCGFCHVGPHPLNPPEDVENPKWENLSSFIGGQYLRPQPVFGNLLPQRSFLHHFLGSQAPGTIDTSLVSTDHINNTNTINAVFEVPARFIRAHANTSEEQSDANLLIPSIEDGRTDRRRHFPRVLIDGSDSCGGFAAFIRVPLNIGTYSEEWANCHNPVIGFKRQRPFRVAASQANSVYWQVNEKYRVPYLANFFTFESRARNLTGQPDQQLPAQNSTRAMKLVHAGKVTNAGPEGDQTVARAEFAKNSDAQRWYGRSLFLQNCAICHSSKQPEGFQLNFTRQAPTGGWRQATLPKPGGAGGNPPPHYSLPMDFQEWGNFKASAAYRDYVVRITTLANTSLTASQQAAGLGLGETDPFVLDNFLSSEIRIPITLVGTNSGRATATNATRGHVWDNFSSEDYKRLPAVGDIHYFNPFLNKAPDAFGNNDTYRPRGGGPGYYRPATLASLWSTAPFIHNNTVGGFYPHRAGSAKTNPTSVRGRLDAFDDAIRKVLWISKRSAVSLNPDVQFEQQPGDLRLTDSWATQDARGNADPGYIYRIPLQTEIAFEGAFIEPLVRGVTGPLVFSILKFWLWLALFLLWAAAYFQGGPRHAGIFLLFVGLLIIAAMLLTGAGSSTGTTMGALVAATTPLFKMSSWLLWSVALAVAALGLSFLLGASNRWVGYLTGWVAAFTLLALAAVIVLKSIGAGVNRLPGPIAQAPDSLLWAGLAIIGATLALIYTTRRHPRWPSKAIFATLAALALLGGIGANAFLSGRLGGVHIGPIPKGVPVNLLMNLDPAKGPELARGLVAMVRATSHIKKHDLKDKEAYRYFADHAGAELLNATTCPDFVLDRGHYFGEHLSDYTEDIDGLGDYRKELDTTVIDARKEALISFLKTL